MEGNNLIKKGLVVAVILLFISVSVIPSTGTTDVKQSTICISNNPPYVPSNPIPPNGSSNVTPTCLEWTGGDPDGDVVTYNVYFGKTTPPPLIVVNISQTIYCPSGNWEFNTTYYWKVVAWDEHGASTKGPIWSFTTMEGSPPPYGPKKGLPGVNYTFYFDLPDNPDCEPYYVMWDWGDGDLSDWMGPFASGETVCATHSWAEPGDYDIRVKIKDDWGNSYWSYPLTIHIYFGPVLAIRNITGSFWKIGAEISNNGDYYAVNVCWEIYTHKITITPVYFGGGTISILYPGESDYVSFFKPIFGFGRFKIIVKVECENASSEKTVDAFMFFVFVII